MTTRTLPILLLLTLLTACSGSAPAVVSPTPSPSPTMPPSPTPLPSPTMPPPTPTSSGGPEEVTIEASDGLLIRGTFYPAGGTDPTPAVLLLHMHGSNRQAWSDFIPQLTSNGYAALALDLRGHGVTGGEENWVLAEDDLLRAWEYLAKRPETDPERMGLIGASIGANMALLTAADQPQAKAVVLLSPGEVYLGVESGSALQRYGSRPVLLVASQEDQYSAQSVEKLAQSAQGEVQVQVYDGSAHGTDLLAGQPDLSPLILEWLDRNIKGVPAENGNTGANSVSFTTEDGVTLGGTLYGDGPAALILSGTGEGLQANWDSALPDLLAAGYRVLTFDWRGHGASSGAADEQASLKDLRAAWTYLQGLGMERVGLVGAGLGGTASANLALEQTIGALVFLSSPRQAAGMSVPDETLATEGLPKYFANSKGDRFAEDTRSMFDLAAGPKEIHMYPGEAHDEALFAAPYRDDLVQSLLQFLETNFR